jgi:ATP-dependent RNA helicase DeaD
MISEKNNHDQSKKKQDSEPDNSIPEISMEELSPKMREAMQRAGWKDLMPVQAKAMPYMLSSRDIMIQSRTGSGKTGAFILPLIEKVNPNNKNCQALILVPTRELARQVAEDSKLLCGDKINTVPVYGGVGYGAQIEGFRKGAHIVVGTPGRILDHLLKRSLSIQKLKYLIFDEADRLLSMGFFPDMLKIKKHLPHRGRESYMFSATFPHHVMYLAGEFLRNPEILSLSRDHVHVADTRHVYYEVPAMEKERCLVRIIEMENPNSAIIFCNTKSRVHFVSVVLQRFGYDADELSSDLSQSARERILQKMRNSSLRFLVATDVAARGIDIPELSHVFLYEPPEDPEAYIHRAGRTGRAGAAGTAISLVDILEESDLGKIAKLYNIDLEKRELPTAEDVEQIVSERVTALLEARLRERDRLKEERSRRFLPLARNLGESEEELSIIAMLLDDYYQKSLHAPPVQKERSQTRPPKEKAKRPRIKRTHIRRRPKNS